MTVLFIEFVKAELLSSTRADYNLLKYFVEQCESKVSGYTCFDQKGQFRAKNCKYCGLSNFDISLVSAGCKIISHRGGADIAPENTLAAIDKSLASGAYACEIDVRCTSDGHVILMHDETADRTTNGSGPVAEMTLSEVQSLDAGIWKGGEYAGQRVPSLAEVFSLMKDKGQKLLVELKDPGAGKTVAVLAEEYSMSDQVIILSEDIDVLRKLNSVNPRMQRAFLCTYFPRYLHSTAAKVDWLCRQADAAGLTLVDLDYRLVSPELILSLHREFLKVWVWTVNSVSIMKCLLDWGADGITTDRPDIVSKSGGDKTVVSSSILSSD